MWADISGKKFGKLHLLTRDKLTLNDPDSYWVMHRLIFVCKGKLFHGIPRVFKKFPEIS